jgi:hypothetical protein
MSPKREKPKAAVARAANPALSKKEQILSLFAGGITEVDDLALITNTRPSYVAGVLQGNDLKPGYFDLYTSSNQPMNLYSKFFAGKLGFKDVDRARESVELIDRLYRQFETGGDRAGQHHSLLMALTMFDRARWTGKEAEANVFRRWLLDRLSEEEQAAGLPATRKGRGKGDAPL